MGTIHGVFQHPARPRSYFLVGVLATMALGAVAVSTVLVLNGRGRTTETTAPVAQSSSSTAPTTTPTTLTVDMIARIQASVAVVTRSAQVPARASWSSLGRF